MDVGDFKVHLAQPGHDPVGPAVDEVGHEITIFAVSLAEQQADRRGAFDHFAGGRLLGDDPAGRIPRRVNLSHLASRKPRVLEEGQGILQAFARQIRDGDVAAAGARDDLDDLGHPDPGIGRGILEDDLAARRVVIEIGSPLGEMEVFVVELGSGLGYGFAGEVRYRDRLASQDNPGEDNGHQEKNEKKRERISDKRRQELFRHQKRSRSPFRIYYLLS